MIRHKGVLHSDETANAYRAQLDKLACGAPFLGPIDRVWDLICKSWRWIWQTR